jgi:hypothetical protein
MKDGVTFEWTQKPPAMCSASNYVGTVACALANGGLTVTGIDGTLVLDLVGPSESQELKVEKGTLTLLPGASNGMPLTAAVTGTASCATKQFSGMIPQRDFSPDEIGVLQNVALVLLCATDSNSYKGAILGDLEADGSLSGTLSLTLGSCECISQFRLRPQR